MPAEAGVVEVDEADRFPVDQDVLRDQVGVDHAVGIGRLAERRVRVHPVACPFEQAALARAQVVELPETSPEWCGTRNPVGIPMMAVKPGGGATQRPGCARAQRVCRAGGNCPTGSPVVVELSQKAPIGSPFSHPSRSTWRGSGTDSQLTTSKSAPLADARCWVLRFRSAPAPAAIGAQRADPGLNDSRSGGCA